MTDWLYFRETGHFSLKPTFTHESGSPELPRLISFTSSWPRKIPKFKTSPSISTGTSFLCLTPMVWSTRTLATETGERLERRCLWLAMVSIRTVTSPSIGWFRTIQETWVHRECLAVTPTLDPLHSQSQRQPLWTTSSPLTRKSSTFICRCTPMPIRSCIPGDTRELQL